MSRNPVDTKRLDRALFLNAMRDPRTIRACKPDETPLPGTTVLPSEVIKKGLWDPFFEWYE